tara:strand:- start:8884 stop:10182 length:1299 start_codon:yes stop_codon:yes gene_type:complete
MKLIKYLVIIFAMSYQEVVAKTKMYGDRKSNMRTFGDEAMVFLPAGAALGSLIIGDYQGTKELFLGTGMSQLIIVGLKESTHRQRPDHKGSYKSFPSGHSAAAFSGAAYLHHRYGSAWAYPGYTIASIVAYSRVYANKHHIDDVIASASIAVFNSLLFTSSHVSDAKISVLPYFSSDGLGAQMSIKIDGSKSQTIQPSKEDFDFQYELITGGKNYEKNVLFYKEKENINLNEVSSHNKYPLFATPQITAHITSNFFYQGRLSLFENLDDGIIDQGFNFQNKSYLSNEHLVFSLRQYELSQLVFYDFFPESDWIFQLGAGLGISQHQIRIDNILGDKFAQYKSFDYYPKVMLGMGMELTNKFTLAHQGTIGHNDNITSHQLESYILYNINSRWYVRLIYGLEYLKRDIIIQGDLYYQHKIDAQYGALSVGYRF